MRASVAMTLLSLLSFSAPPAVALSPALTRGYAFLASQFNSTSGCWGGDCVQFLWTSANELESVANYYALTRDASAGALLRSAALGLRPFACDCWHDDNLWLVLAWARASAVSGDGEHLAAAQALFADMVGPWAAWNATCGGVNWEKGVPYRNTITNTLFLTAAMRLHAATAGGPLDPGRVAGLTYLEWAQREWAWLNSTALYRPAEGIFADGLSEATCDLGAFGGAFWTYNAGVLLDGAVLLAAATGQPALADFAVQVARAAAAYFADAGDDARVLRELSCGRPDGRCGGKDGQQFKGAFIRHLGYAAEALPPSHAADAAWARAYIANQTRSIAAENSRDEGETTQFGLLWQGPFDADEAEPWVAHGAALDALLAGAMLGEGVAGASAAIQ